MSSFFNRYREFLIFLVAVFIYVFFIEIFEGLITDIFITDFLDKIYSSTVKDILIITVFIFSFLFFIYNIRVRKIFPSNTSLLISTILLFIYIYYRAFTNWPYTGLELYDKIKYTDLIFLISFFFFTGYYRKNKIHNHQENQKKENLLLEDSHQTFGGKDLYRREKLSKNVSEFIKKTFPEKSFAIGIVGKWGSGKTVFMEQVKSEIRSDSEIIIVDFNAWLNEGSVEIIENFFKSLQAELKIHDSKLSNQIGEYSEALISIEPNFFTKSINHIFKSIYPVSTSTAQYETIKGSLIRLNKKIVIFIDDLDRLAGEEINEVLRIIRNTANFPNIFFIVAYDYHYIDSSLKSFKSYNSQNYLEKIFQLEIPLPHYQKSIVSASLITLLKENKDELDSKNIENALNELRNERLSDDKGDFISSYIDNLRDAVRFSNSINIIFNLIKDEVDLVDFFHIELIKLKYKEVHQWLGEKKFLNESIDDGRLTLVFNKERFRIYVNDRLLTLNIDESDKINRSIEHIFRLRKNKSVRSITDPANFLIYFSPELYDKIPLSELKDLKKGSFKTLLRKLDEWMAGPERSDLIKILLENTFFENRKDFELMMEVILYLSKYDIAYWRMSMFSILNKVASIIEKYYGNDENGKKEYKDFLVYILSSGKKPSVFQSSLTFDFLYVIIKGDSNFDNLFTKDELQDIAYEHLEKYLLENPDIDSNSFSLYYNNIESIDPTSNVVIITEKANQLFQRYIRRNSHGYFKLLIRPYASNSDDFLTLEPYIDQVFQGYDNFETFLKEASGSFAVYELQTFYRRFKNNLFQPIKFDRGTFLEFVSDDTFYHVDDNGKRTPSIMFDHHGFDDFYSTYPEFKFCKWIAHQYPISDEEAKEGGAYKFQKQIYIESDVYRKIVSATFSFLVDDECSITLNGRSICNNIFTGRNVWRDKITKDLFNQGANTIELIIKNSKPKVSENVTAKENPYGIVLLFTIELSV